MMSSMQKDASTARRILLVGHCGPDSSYLRIAVKSALGDVVLVSADDSPSMNHALDEGVDLVLLNRELGYGFEPDTGVEMIGQLKHRCPELRMMLVSNYPEAQAAAIAAGALPGFGKRQIGSPQVKELLRDATGIAAK